MRQTPHNEPHPVFAPSPLPGDKDAYNAAQARMLAILESQGVAGFETEAFRQQWQIAEDCKNRNGGMPPK